MEIIDAQFHEPAPWLPWPHDESSRVTLSVEMTLAQMDAAGVDAALLTSSRPEYMAQAIRLHPDRFACLAEWSPDAPDIEDLLANTRSEPGMLGIRLLEAGWPPENIERLRAGHFNRFFAAAQRHEVPVAIMASGAIADVGPVARAFPDLTLVLDHFGHRQPPFQERAVPPLKYVDELVELAQFPNVSVKFSGAPTLSHEPFPYRDLWPNLHRIIDAFGPSRLMWGSDITRITALFRCPAVSPEDIRMPRQYPGKHSYADAVHFLLHTNEVSETEKEQLFAQTIRRIFRWPRPGVENL